MCQKGARKMWREIQLLSSSSSFSKKNFSARKMKETFSSGIFMRKTDDEIDDFSGEDKRSKGSLCTYVAIFQGFLLLQCDLCLRSRRLSRHIASNIFMTAP